MLKNHMSEKPRVASFFNARISSAIFVIALVVLCCIFDQVSAAGGYSNEDNTAAFSPDVEIQVAGRTVDLRSNIEEQLTEYTIHNKGTLPLEYFLVAIPAKKVNKLALVTAALVKNNQPLQASQVKLLGPDKGAAVFQVKFANPLKPGKLLRVEVKESFIHTMKPLPESIEQSDTQLVEYEDYVRIYSVYPLVQQMTQFILASSEVENFRPRAGAERRGATVSYGPYYDTPAWYEADEFYAHFENNAPFATARVLVRNVEVSHWGNVAIDENYLLEHTGAKLVGGFSRAQYQSRSQKLAGKASFRSLRAELPTFASDVYFRDAIGNVSTTWLRPSSTPGKLTNFVVSPRYPMFGGWKTDMEMGYNVPARGFLSRGVNDKEDYSLEVPFGTPFGDLAVDELVVHVVLPEGASDIEWHAPFDVDSITYSKKVTYLDTTGRPSIEFRKKNISPGHNQSIQVTYRFSPIHLAREPGMLIAAIFAFLVAVMIYVRIDWSFNASTTQVAESKRKSE